VIPPKDIEKLGWEEGMILDGTVINPDLPPNL